MTVTEIREGEALRLAIMAQYRLLLESLIQTLNTCSTPEMRMRQLSPKGKAALSRLKELFSHGVHFSMIYPTKPCETGEDAVDILTPLWARLFFYPEISEEQFLLYAESTVLICDLLEYGGWFE